LSKVFYTEEVETHALSNITLEIQTGEFVSIAGPSGCGKTTLLSILGLLDSPTAGKYKLDGEPVENLSASQRAKIRNQAIGFIFQAFNLIGDLTVYENVELPLTYRGMPGSERKERVQASLERVGMAHRMGHYPSQLSGGQQQRVAVARAIVGKPLILLADEPTGNLDSGAARRGGDDLHGDARSEVRAHGGSEHPPLRRPGRQRGRRAQGPGARAGRLRRQLSREYLRVRSPGRRVDGADVMRARTIGPDSGAAIGCGGRPRRRWGVR
jgi:putative ABC transport system ATP-binding protein